MNAQSSGYGQNNDDNGRGDLSRRQRRQHLMESCAATPSMVKARRQDDPSPRLTREVELERENQELKKQLATAKEVEAALEQESQELKKLIELHKEIINSTAATNLAMMKAKKVAHTLRGTTRDLFGGHNGPAGSRAASVSGPYGPAEQCSIPVNGRDNVEGGDSMEYEYGGQRERQYAEEYEGQEHEQYSERYDGHGYGQYHADAYQGYKQYPQEAYGHYEQYPEQYEGQNYDQPQQPGQTVDGGQQPQSYEQEVREHVSHDHDVSEPPAHEQMSGIKTAPAADAYEVAQNKHSRRKNGPIFEDGDGNQVTVERQPDASQRLAAPPDKPVKEGKRYRGPRKNQRKREKAAAEQASQSQPAPALSQSQPHSSSSQRQEYGSQTPSGQPPHEWKPVDYPPWTAYDKPFFLRPR